MKAGFYTNLVSIWNTSYDSPVSSLINNSLLLSDPFCFSFLSILSSKTLLFQRRQFFGHQSISIAGDFPLLSSVVRPAPSRLRSHCEDVLKGIINRGGNTEPKGPSLSSFFLFFLLIGLLFYFDSCWLALQEKTFFASLQIKAVLRSEAVKKVIRKTFCSLTSRGCQNLHLCKKKNSKRFLQSNLIESKREEEGFAVVGHTEYNAKEIANTGRNCALWYYSSSTTLG